MSTGIVDNREMRVLSTNGKYNNAVDFDFRLWGRRCTGLDVRIDNDARGALIGEWMFGAGRGARNLVMMTIGTGIGTAVIVDGKPLVGAHFSGGNLGGHIVVKSGGRTCTCGGRGCLETEASGWALPTIVGEHRLYSSSTLKDIGHIGFKEVREAAFAGDACASDVWNHCLTYWGEALVSFIHLFDPERIIIGGGVMNDPGPVLEHVRATVSSRVWSGGEQVDIVSAEYPDHAGLIGAAGLFHAEQEVVLWS